MVLKQARSMGGGLSMYICIKISTPAEAGNSETTFSGYRVFAVELKRKKGVNGHQINIVFAVLTIPQTGYF
jgi:hypothetical protein